MIILTGLFRYNKEYNNMITHTQIHTYIDYTDSKISDN